MVSLSSSNSLWDPCVLTEYSLAAITTNCFWWHLWLRGPAKTQTSLSWCAVSPEPLHLLHIIIYGGRPEPMHLAPLDSWACMLKEAFNIFVICIILTGCACLKNLWYVLSHIWDTICPDSLHTFRHIQMVILFYLHFVCLTPKKICELEYVINIF